MVFDCKSDPKVSQGHSYWCHYTDETRFPIDLLLYISCTVSKMLLVISKSLKRSRDHEHIIPW